MPKAAKSEKKENSDSNVSGFRCTSETRVAPMAAKWETKTTYNSEEGASSMNGNVIRYVLERSYTGGRRTKR